MITPRQRTLDFIAGKEVDRLPFHPIIMRWAAEYGGVKYRDFCLRPECKCAAAIKCAEDFDMDWVTVMSDPFTEAEAFGLKIEYPEDSLPEDCGGHPESAAAAAELKPYKTADSRRTMGRVQEIEEFKRLTGDQYFIVGWVEGPMAEYADLRGAGNASLDLFDDPESVHKAMDVIVEAALGFMTCQIEAGADCIGVGDAFASQIGRDLYMEFVFEREKVMIEHIQSKGALAKLHICGNTSAILPDMIKTGADIIDVDHLVPSMTEFAGLLGPKQVFCGKADPVSVIKDGDAQRIAAAVAQDVSDSNGRCIVSAGCEIPPGTSPENMRAFQRTSVNTELQSNIC